jgi:hypothetical protein
MQHVVGRTGMIIVKGVNIFVVTLQTVWLLLICIIPWNVSAKSKSSIF